MAYTDVPSAVGMLRPAAAPRLALAAPQPDRRRALELLAASRDHCTEAIRLALHESNPEAVSSPTRCAGIEPSRYDIPDFASLTGASC
jgi:hypothetical protein